MNRSIFAVAALLAVLTQVQQTQVQQAQGQQAGGQQIDLTASIDSFDLVNVQASIVEYQGQSAVKITGTRPEGAPDMRGPRTGPAPNAARPSETPQGPRATRPQGGPRRVRRESIAILKDTEFRNGTIDIELAGRPSEAAGANARGFIGVVFHVEKADPIRYDCFYLRPTNGRADDQLRRNHSCQYMSHPDFPFNVLRREFPGVYESYVDLVPGQWTNVKIEVANDTAKLYVHGREQPCLVVNDLKRAGHGGPIGLWIEQSTEAYFRNLVITSE